MEVAWQSSQIIWIICEPREWQDFVKHIWNFFLVHLAILTVEYRSSGRRWFGARNSSRLWQRFLAGHCENQFLEPGQIIFSFACAFDYRLICFHLICHGRKLYSSLNVLKLVRIPSKICLKGEISYCQCKRVCLERHYPDVLMWMNNTWHEINWWTLELCWARSDRAKGVDISCSIATIIIFQPCFV